MVQLASPLLFNRLGGTGFEPKSNRKDVLVFRSMLGHQAACLPSQIQGRISRQWSRLPVMPMAKDRVAHWASWWIARATFVRSSQNSAARNGRVTLLDLGVLPMILRRPASRSSGSRAVHRQISRDSRCRETWMSSTPPQPERRRASLFFIYSCPRSG